MDEVEPSHTFTGPLKFLQHQLPVYQIESKTMHTIQRQEEAAGQCKMLQSEERYKEERQTNRAFNSVLQVGHFL